MRAGHSDNRVPSLSILPYVDSQASILDEQNVAIGCLVKGL